MDPTTVGVIAGLAGTVITGLFGVIAILLKSSNMKAERTHEKVKRTQEKVTRAEEKIDRTQELVEPLSNGYAATTLNELKTIREGQEDLRQEMRGVKADVRNLHEADTTILRMISGLRDHPPPVPPVQAK